jgi:hypothetical protein
MRRTRQQCRGQQSTCIPRTPQKVGGSGFLWDAPRHQKPPKTPGGEYDLSARQIN